MYSIIAICVIALILYFRAGFRQIEKHQRLVVYKDGLKPLVKGPGRAFVLPLFEQSRLIDLTVQTVSLAECKLFGRAQMAMDVSFQYQVVDPVKAAKYRDTKIDTVAAVKRALDAVFAMATLRDCLRQMYVLEGLTADAASAELGTIGIKVLSVKVLSFAFSKNALAAINGVSDRLLSNLCWIIGELDLPTTTGDFIA